MSDQQPPDPLEPHAQDPDSTEPDANGPLTPPQEARVRRLLAAARVNAPIPDEVADRLDNVLGRLQQERHTSAATEDQPTPASPIGPEGTGRVVPFRRRAAQVLVAAAAVAVIGVGITQVLPGGDGGSDSSGSADSGGNQLNRDSGAPGDAASMPADDELDGRDDSGGQSEGFEEPSPAAPEPAPSLSRARGDSDLRALLDNALPSAPIEPPGCSGVPGRDGDLFARADRGTQPVVVRFRPTGREGFWRALVFPCGDGSHGAPEKPGRTFRAP